MLMQCVWGVFKYWCWRMTGPAQVVAELTLAGMVRWQERYSQMHSRVREE